MIFVKIPKYVTFDHFLFFTTISLNNYYGPGNWTCIQKNSEQLEPTIPQQNIGCTTMICVLTVNDSTSDFGAAMKAPNWTLLVSNLTTTNQVDTDVNNDDDSQHFETHIENNHIEIEISDT